jgi:hypothetical protein
MPNREEMRAYQAVGLLSQLGLVIAIPLVAGVLGGVWADRQFGLAPAGVLVGVFGGLAVGIYGAWQILKTMLD